MLGGAAVVFSILLAFSGICKIFGAFTLDINKMLIDINDIVVDSQKNLSADNRIEIAKKLYAAIDFHSISKQLRNFN